ncbi:hypothetical protein E2562_015750 [Oryza meyeriana var. granulata]|uniref:Uncharacterized protein n=1 Tax=Oryza meyeriana var. granulata TaxID=110450 RepID=A0A6G1D527_9ORYZ|nr:hypothetical protein E2562_015750 [Oryza meyeriana var. granulata]
MAALRPAWSPPHLAVAAASSSPSASTPAFLPLTSRRRRPSPAPVRRIQFRSHCLKSPAEPEPERGHEDGGGDERIDKFQSRLALRTPPDMLRKEKDQISVIVQKMYSSSSDILNSIYF